MAVLIGSFAPITIGETRQFTVESSKIVLVIIRCFVRPPEPAEYKPCAECGVIYRAPGELLSFTPSFDTYQGGDGGVKIFLRELDSDLVTVYNIKVGNYPENEPQLENREW